MSKKENKTVNYMLDIIKKNRGIFTEEYIKEALILYCNVEIENRKREYRNSFTYSLNSRANKSHEIKKDDWEKIDGANNLFVYWGNNKYEEKELTAQGSKIKDDVEIFEFTDEKNNLFFYTEENGTLLEDFNHSAINDVLRLTKTLKKEIDDFFKKGNVYTYIYKNYIFRYIDESIHIDHRSKTVLSYLDSGEESEKSQDYTDRNKFKKLQRRSGLYYLGIFINDLLSDNERNRKDAKKVLEKITEKIDNRFYRMIFFMAKYKNPEKLKKHPTKEKGFGGVFKKKGVKSIPAILKNQYKEDLLRGIALLLFYESSRFYSYVQHTVKGRVGCSDGNKRAKEELIELVSTLVDWMNENLHKSYLKVYVDIIKNLQKLIFTELDIKYRIDIPDAFTGIRELNTATYHFDEEYASLCGYEESVDITKELIKINDIFKNIDSILECVDHYNSEYDRFFSEKRTSHARGE